MKQTDFVAAGDPGFTPSGWANFDLSFAIHDLAFQQQFLDTCDEIHSVLGTSDVYRIQKQYGINPQLANSLNGVLDSTQANGKKYGIQCILKGMGEFNNVTKTATDVTLASPRLENSVKYTFEPAPTDASDGSPSWVGDEDSAQSCRYCFDEFAVSEEVSENVFVEGVITDTTTIAKVREAGGCEDKQLENTGNTNMRARRGAQTRNSNNLRLPLCLHCMIGLPSPLMSSNPHSLLLAGLQLHGTLPHPQPTLPFRVRLP